jgi:telomere length regulation protein
MIAAQGTFVECAAPAPVTLRLASALLELVASPAVHKHEEPYVRRAALIAASQVLMLPRVE